MQSLKAAMGGTPMVTRKGYPQRLQMPVWVPTSTHLAKRPRLAAGVVACADRRLSTSRLRVLKTDSLRPQSWRLMVAELIGSRCWHARCRPRVSQREGAISGNFVTKFVHCLKTSVHNHLFFCA